MNKVLIQGAISPNIYETPEKYLLCTGVPLARTGMYKYNASENLSDLDGKPLPPDADGFIEVYKDEAVLFSPETIASFEGKPVTIGHVMLDPKNSKFNTVGHAQNVRRGEGDFKDNLVADLLITDDIAIQAIKSGLREISLGYDAGYISDGAGKAHQVTITGNHIALVPVGKAGHQCRIFDSVDLNPRKEKKSMSMAEKLKSLFCSTVDEAVKNGVLDEGQGGSAGAPSGTGDKTPPANPPAQAQQTPAKDEPPANPQPDKFDVLSAKLDKLIELMTAKVIDEKTPPQGGQGEPAPDEPAPDAMVNVDPNKPILVEANNG